jgi:hypothetical protein
MLRPIRFPVQLGLLVTCIGIGASGATSAQAAEPTASAAAVKMTTCGVSSLYQKPGYPSYVEALSVHAVSCGSGDKLIKAYQACRVKHGGSTGKCTGKVTGYTCHEKRSTSPATIIGLVSCTRGAAAVKFSYSQLA